MISASTILGIPSLTSERGENKEVPGLVERLHEVIDQWTLARQHHGVRAFAKESGIPYSSLKDYLEGTQPSAWALWRIASTANVSADYLLTGTNKTTQRTPDDHVDALIAALHMIPYAKNLKSRDHQRRFKDFVSYVAHQLRRLVFDVDKLAAELYARQRGEEFEAGEHRRRLLNREDEP